jgi:tetratricopeptide (TPR) repeat protein
LVPVDNYQARDEEESEARGDTETTRESAPSCRKRRASDSFDLQDCGALFDDETELVRVSSAKSKLVSREDSLEDETNRHPSISETPFVKPELSLCVDEFDDDEEEDEPLVHLENVTAKSRSLIPPELLKPPRPKPKLSLRKNKMATATTTSTDNNMSSSGKSNSSRLRKRLSGLGNSKKGSKREMRDEAPEDSQPQPPSRPSQQRRPASSDHRSSKEEDAQQLRGRQNARPPSLSDDEPMMSRAKSLNEVPPIMTVGSEETPVKSNRTPRSQSPPPKESRGHDRPGLVERIRSASRSRSRSRSRKDMDNLDDGRSIMIAVTSCKSDAYHNQKAPGSTSKLPRKAPSNLKLFHELAVGVKDAYAAAGETPTRPDPEEWSKHMSKKEIAGRTVLWEFLGNLDFLLALVDEVAIDTATRGALKDDTTFKSLRDVIKKCNKVLETMLVRRERKYTLFFRLVQPNDSREIEKLEAWNSKVEKAIGSVAEGDGTAEDTETDDSESDTVSITSSSTDASFSKKGNVFSRGRQLLPAAGRVRARRATPTPRLRKRRASQNGDSDTVAAEDGYSAVTSPVTSGNLAMLQRSLDASDSASAAQPGAMNLNIKGAAKQQLAPVKPMEPKDELVDVIRGLRLEKMKSKESSGDSELANLKPNWQPKADIPSAVPKLPPEYIHRHRLMKQVVNSLLENAVAGPIDTDEEVPTNTIITSITSRHGDKAGNGKTILAAAAIQTVEVRERFSDGIAWIHLGRNPLSETDVRRLYEELYRQLLTRDFDVDDESDDDSKNSSSHEKGESRSRESSMDSAERRGKTANERDFAIHLANTRRRFEGGDLEGIKEDIGRLLADRKVLICLDDVWRIEDAKWFIFEGRVVDDGPIRDRQDMENPFRILMTTRTPSLLGQGVVQEVFVRIFSEQEAVKLLLSSGGRRPYGGKNSAVYNQARTIVKGCGNAPLAVRIAGGMLRRSNRNWNLRSPIWTALIQQCRANLDEATTLRSFQNAATRVIDLSFATVEDIAMRSAMRRCFVSYAAGFRDNEWVLVGRGIPQAVLLKLFATVIGKQGTNLPSPANVLQALEAMNLLQRARHGCTSRSHVIVESSSDGDSSDDEEPKPVISAFIENPSFLMHESIKSIAEEIGQRSTRAFLPTPDEFTTFGREIEAEKTFIDNNQGSFWNPLRYLPQSLSNSKYSGSKAMEESAVNELIIASMLDVSGSLKNASIPDAFRMSKNEISSPRGVDKMEEYLATFLPAHLIRAKAYSSAADILVDPHFVGRRVRALGVIESTRRHVADLLELRREVSKLAPSSGIAKRSKNFSSGSHDEADDELQEETLDSIEFEPNAVLRDGARLIIDEAYNVVNRSSASLDSLNMAICLAAVGEGLLKGRQPRDAMLRLEEAVGIYRGLLGAYHIDVARALHNVAKALVKLGETRVALLKFSEAARIYDACNATLHYDSIANAQNLATLLVDIGDWTQADEKLEEVISMKRSVHGANSVIVAKAINNYAILLAKHGRMNEALVHYQSAMDTYAAASQPMIRDPEFELKCNYDMTLISLNIASILSKKGDLEGAIRSYESGVEGLRSHSEEQQRLGVSSKGNSHNKHLVAALGRIGSLKLKLGDREGALEAYMTLLQEVDEDSPRSSQIEKAKAHIKCATICRQHDGKGSRIKSISHLREALEMYTALFGPENKDTLAIASSLRQWLTEEREASNKGSILEMTA